MAWLIWLLLLGVLLWAAARSFSLTDEGALLLSYAYPYEAINGTTQYALIVDHLFGAIHPTIITYRLIKMALSVGATAIFAAGLSRYMAAGTLPRQRSMLTRFGFLWPFIAIGDLFGDGLFGQTLSYNSLNDDILLGCYGLLLAAGSSRRAHIRRAIAYGSTGMLCGVQFFIKFPSSIALLVTCMVAIVILGVDGSIDVRRRLVDVIVLVSGYVVGLCLFFAFVLDYRTWAAGFRFGLSHMSAPGSSHDPHVILVKDAMSIAVLIAVGLLQGLVCGLLFWMYERLTRDRTPHKAMLLFTPIILVCLLIPAAQTTLREASGGWGTIIGFMALIAVGAVLAVVSRRATESGRTGSAVPWGLLAMLFIAPFVGALGSDVPIVSAADGYMAFWVALSAVLLSITPDVAWNRAVLATLRVLPMVLVVAVLVEGLVLHPYRVPTSLFDQQSAVTESGKLRHLMVDRRTADFIDSAHRLIAASSRFRPGDPIISAYDIPGLVYALGGVSPGAPWFFGWQSEQERNCAELRASDLKDMPAPIVIVKPTLSASFQACLHDVYHSFPGGYRLAGTLRDPDDGEAVHILVPRL